MKKPSFIEFWHTYAPQKQYHNRFIACRKLWESMSDTVCAQILAELQKETGAQPHEKNPYFYLTDWQPPQPHWLSPREVGYLLAQHVRLAVCRNPQTNTFGTVTLSEANVHRLEVHHLM
jgi:hypothetical protein